MKRFSYLFSANKSVAQQQAIQDVVSAVFNTLLLKPLAKTTLVKVGGVTADGLVGEDLSLPQLLHLLDCENPWRSRSAKSIASAWWEGNDVYAFSVFGLSDVRASKLHSAVNQNGSFLAAVPQTQNVVCEYVLDRMLMPLVAFSRSACATSGALHLGDLAPYKLGQPVYMDPELFVLRDAFRRWAGESSEGEQRPKLFP